MEKFKNKSNWTLTILDTIDFIAWRTKFLFGISKTTLYKKAIKFALQYKNKKEEEIIKLFEKELKKERREARVQNEYDKAKNNLYIDPEEAERRLRYFSEDILNKEFDIFINLISDEYLNTLYKKIFKLKRGNWNTFGNGMSFHEITKDIKKLANDMQMDNLAYDTKNKILVANELKLSASKNKDQILKYYYLFEKLKEFNLIDNKTQFYLLFLSVKNENINTEFAKIELEKNKNKKFKNIKLKDLEKINIANFTWFDLIDFNKKFLNNLEKTKQQTEIKLIEGFNNSLMEKYYIKKN